MSSGGSIRIEGRTVSLSTVTVNGGINYANGGQGRIAVYYHNSINTSLTPNEYTTIQQIDPNTTPTPTPTGPTPTPTGTPLPLRWRLRDSLRWYNPQVLLRSLS
ncbi:MAG TPA: hypothetical protein VNK49_04545 [Anaerolineales bacterium]|nr:hypothetical protein [Anaerolineales bacterium]